jgi:hypothetical protein
VAYIVTRTALVHRYAGRRMNQGATMVETKGWYLGLTNPHKQIFLATVGAHLTVLARSSDSLETLQGLNEAFHQLFNQIEAIGMVRDRKADSAQWDKLHSLAAQHKLTDGLTDALEHTKSSMAIDSSRSESGRGGPTVRIRRMEEQRWPTSAMS